MTETISMQLYSGRNFPPLDAQLALLARIGYRDVETFRGLYDDVEGLKRGLDAHGLTVKSAHYSVDFLESDFARALSIARTLGNEIMVLPYLTPEERPTDGAGWRAFGNRVAGIAKRVAGEGLRCAWHNHDFEMRPLADGSRPIEHILESDMSLEWEADLAWIVRGGEDPATWLTRYKGRLSALHVKDIAPAGEKADEDGWADVGAGTLGWDRLWRLGREAGATLMIAEHDNPADFERFATASYAAMRAYAERN
ncbi:xylose isomerase [Aureimonas endophytica]|uniref:Xylose isomerase n=1 Tax=Aureimonas endophytica TaxID=2027858 RepID=A0A916ZGW1_9HYPH|nr:sugar phosphate isomerase/epimerase [Aureimonas endophytica]GGD95536.1 xylose isomerase [Aureimonas endophytica]